VIDRARACRARRREHVCALRRTCGPRRRCVPRERARASSLAALALELGAASVCPSTSSSGSVTRSSDRTGRKTTPPPSRSRLDARPSAGTVSVLGHRRDDAADVSRSSGSSRDPLVQAAHDRRDAQRSGPRTMNTAGTTHSLGTIDTVGCRSQKKVGSSPAGSIRRSRSRSRLRKADAPASSTSRSHRSIRSPGRDSSGSESRRGKRVTVGRSSHIIADLERRPAPTSSSSPRQDALRRADRDIVARSIAS